MHEKAVAGYLYIHIPFCMRKCSYCDFFSVPFDARSASLYSEALCREIGLSKGGRLRTIYFGGGTPTVLPEESFEAIFKALHERFDFSPEMEITVEANPGTIDAGKAAFLRGLGVNRLSLGVQSFSDTELQTLGRIHTAREAEQAAREAGFENISLDLIYGIPGQGIESWRATLGHAVSLGPKHISAYELTPEPGTPLVRLLSEGAVALPGEDAVVGMAELAWDFLAASGYVRYEISNYALPGRECVHNLNYWRRGKYLGIGAGAHSFDGNKRWKNVPDIDAYISRLKDGVLPVEEQMELAPAEAAGEALFLGLRLAEGVDVGAFQKEHGLDLMSAASGLVREGFMEVKGGRLMLTRRGFLLFNPSVVRLMENLGL